MFPEYRLDFNLGELELTCGKSAPSFGAQQDVGFWANTGHGTKGESISLGYFVLAGRFLIGCLPWRHESGVGADMSRELRA